MSFEALRKELIQNVFIVKSVKQTVTLNHYLSMINSDIV